MKPLFLFQNGITPIKKLLLMHLAAGGVPLTEYTATGNPLTFDTNVAKPLTQLLIPWTPTQSGSGDPSPTNVRPISGVSGVTAWRTGKNLFDEQYPDISTTTNYRAIYVGEGKFTCSSTIPRRGIPATVANLFFLPGNVTTGANSSTNGVAVNEPITVTSVDGYVTIAYRNSSPYDPNDYETQIELGETASEYSPYTGETVSVAFPALGKNLFDEVYTDIATGTVKYKSIYVGNVTVTLSTNVGTSSGAVLFILTGQETSGAKTSTNGVWNGQTRTISATDGYITIAYTARDNGNITPVNAHTMLNVGSTAEPYEPYTNTVYGGSLDVTTGVLTATHSVIDLYDMTYVRSTSYANAFYYGKITDRVGGITTDFLCTAFTKDIVHTNGGSFGNNAADLTIAFSADANSQNIYIRYDAYTTTQEFRNAVKGYYVYYPLAEPLTWQLTPQQVTALIGTNVLWSDTNGSNTAKYLKKG